MYVCICSCRHYSFKACSKKTISYPQQPIIIKTNPAAILWGPIVLTSEYRVMIEMPSSKNQAMQFGISYLGKSPIWSAFEKQVNLTSIHKIHFVVTGLRVQVANKFYLVRKKYGSPFGFYVSPLVSYSNARISISRATAYRNSYYDVTQFSASIIAGVQVGRNKKFTADLFGGIGYKKNTWYHHLNSHRVIPFDTEDFGDFYNSPVKLTLGINFGWALY